MTEPNPTVEELQLTKEEQAEAERLLGKNFLGLTQDEQACLSKVLFPDTDLASIEIGGKTRFLKPLPVKISKQLYALLEPFAVAHKNAEQSKEVVNLNNDIIAALTETAKCLAKFYGWDDVQKLAEEELLPLSELQALAVLQQQKNGANDFLSGSLRILVNVMRLHEVTNAKFGSMFTTLLSRKSAVAVSTNSSQDTQVAN